MSEDTENEVKLKRIQIKTESGSKWFKTAQVFVEWINEQKNIYAFLQRLPNQHNEHGLFNTLNQNWQPLIVIAQNELPRLVNDQEQYSSKVEMLVGQFQQQLELGKIFTADAPFAAFVSELVGEEPAKAASALAYFLNFNLNNWDLNVARGVQEAIDWERGLHGKAEYEEYSLQELKQRWDEEFNRQSGLAGKAQQKLDHLNKRAGQLIEAQQKRFDASIERYDQELNKALEKANAELENITRTYDENLALHASVRYWGLQEKYHKRMSIIFGIATIVVAGLVLWGIYEYADHFLSADIKSIHVSKLVTATMIATFGVWIVRTCANLFMAHTHLRTDAQERRTMMHTYLALLRRGQGPKEDERQLILQTLFRPSTTGIIKEDAGPSNLVDMLNRLAPGKSHN